MFELSLKHLVPSARMKQLNIVLASSSPYRASLLAQLQLDFHQHSPDVNETALDNETPLDLTTRLSFNKANALTSIYPNHMIIGSDQVATHNNKIFGKPLNQENALQQLSRFSNQQLTFYTGLCVYNTAQQQYKLDCISTTVKFKELSQAKIARYIDKEQPFNCAGSFKSEGLGIGLFEYIRSDDPYAIIGLPLIRLASMLEELGQDII